MKNSTHHFQVRISGWAWGQFQGGYMRTIASATPPTADTATTLANQLLGDRAYATQMFGDFQRIDDVEIFGVTLTTEQTDTPFRVVNTTDSVLLRPWDDEGNAMMFFHEE
jgi:hypothetical protein